MESYFAGRLGVGPRVPVAALDELPFFKVVEILDRVGILSIAGYSQSAGSSKSLKLPPAEVRAEGYQIVAEDRFEELLEKIYRNFRKLFPSKAPTLMEAYGWFYHWHNHQGKSSTYLADRVLRHAGKNFHVDPRPITSNSAKISDETRSILTRRTGSLTEIGRACKISPPYIGKIVDSYGIVRVRREQAGRAKSSMINRTDAETLLTLIPRLVDKADAAMMLGYKRFRGQSVVEEMVKNGLLVPFLNGPPECPRVFRIVRDDVTDLLAQLAAKCERGRPTRGALRIGGPAIMISVAKVCRALLDEEVSRAWFDDKTQGIGAIWISKQDLKFLRDHDARHRLAAPEGKPPAPSFDHWRQRANQLLSKPA